MMGISVFGICSGKAELDVFIIGFKYVRTDALSIFITSRFLSLHSFFTVCSKFKLESSTDFSLQQDIFTLLILTPLNFCCSLCLHSHLLCASLMPQSIILVAKLKLESISSNANEGIKYFLMVFFN